jgi:hypothetical protein
MAAPLVLYHDLDGFRRWLDAELFRRFGRAKSNRSICIEAGLPENALYRVLTRGDPPGVQFCQRMAQYLHIPVAELERRAGQRPALELRTDGPPDVSALSLEEQRSLAIALAAALESLASTPLASTTSD